MVRPSKKTQPHYIKVLSGCIYRTSPMETLLIDFGKKAYKFKAMSLAPNHKKKD